MENTVIEVRDFNAGFGKNQVLKNISLNIEIHQILSIMGPSGCGKSTFLRCMNRLHEISPGAWTRGSLQLNGEDIYSMNPFFVRYKIGMVFQSPNPFPNLNIYDNVIAGFKLNGIKISKPERDLLVEKSLRSVALWDEVKDSLLKKGNLLSGGQQQRLCIARAIAMEPSVILLDEPTSALDPISTETLETLFLELRKKYTLVLVTHNLKQAERVSDKTAFLLGGELIEISPSTEFFQNPRDPRTRNFIAGKTS